MSEEALRPAVTPPSVPGGCVTVLYIAGFWRSGSTILDRTLGSLDSFVSTGELVVIWRKHLRGQGQGDNYCSCGKRLDRCEFWNAVFRHAFGAEPTAEIAAMARDLFPLLTKSQLPALLWPGLLTAEASRRRSRVVQALGRFYRAIADVSGALVIVDSSKAPRYGYLLAQVPEIDLRVIHLIRDSRAVAYSHSQPKPNPRTNGQTMTRGVFRCALGWNANNLMVEAGPLRRRSHFARLRYEDFVRGPQPALRQAFTQLGLSSYDRLPQSGDLELLPGHLCFGNVVRHQSGPTRLREDTAWQTKLPRRQRWLVAAISSLLLKRYGYPLP
jgi:Sulfotransferase family